MVVEVQKAVANVNSFCRVYTEESSKHVPVDKLSTKHVHLTRGEGCVFCNSTSEISDSVITVAAVPISSLRRCYKKTPNFH